MDARRILGPSALVAVALLLLTSTLALAQISDRVFLPFVDNTGEPGTIAASSEATTDVPLASTSDITSTIHYVKHDATGADNGTSWTDAYTDLQDALAAATAGDEIWVAQGVYVPGTDEYKSFELVDDVALYGGFSGTESALAARNCETHVTVLSGDIEGNDVTDANGVVNDTENIVGKNTRHVVATGKVTRTAILDGFSITGGDGGNGGGLSGFKGSPTLANLVISGNRANGWGGGIYGAQQSNPILTNVIIQYNTASDGAGMFNDFHCSPVLHDVVFASNRSYGNGAGMYNRIDSNPELTSVTFTDNRVEYWLGAGGGMYNDHSHPVLDDVVFKENYAGESGGGMANGFESRPTLTDVVFSGNSASFGGGMWNKGDVRATLDRVVFTGNFAQYGGGIANHTSSPTVSNSVFFENEGGAVYVEEGSAGALFNVTLLSNTGGGVVASELCPFCLPVLRNSILWANTPEQIVGSADVAYSDVQAGWPGQGNIDVSPLFVDAANRDLRLDPASPVINLGDDAAVPDDVTTDLDGNPRILFGQVDLGAYEATETAPRYVSTPPLTAQEEVPYGYEVVTVDPDDSEPNRTFSAPTKPGWLTLTDHGDGTATLSGTPSAEHAGLHPVTVRCLDKDGHLAEQSFTLHVASDVIHLPALRRQ